MDKRVQYLADTNIYRNFVRNKTIQDVKKLVYVFKNKKVVFGFPIVVAEELIFHLVDDDNEQNECYLALCLLYHSLDTECKSIEFYPPFIDDILLIYFFNKTSEDFNNYSQTIELTRLLTQDYSIDNINKFKELINNVKHLTNERKLSDKKSFESFFKNVNNEEIDWNYFGKKENKTIRRDFFKDIKEKGKFSFIMAKGMMQRAYKIMNIDYINDIDSFNKLIEFYNNFIPGIKMYEMIFEQIAHGNVKMQDISYKTWNSLIDATLIFGCLYNIQQHKRIFITEEKKIIEFFDEFGFAEYILNLDKFKTNIGI